MDKISSSIKKEKSLIKEFSLVIYPVTLVVALGKNLAEELNKRYCDPTIETLSFDSNSLGQCWFLFNKKDKSPVSLIWAEDLEQFGGSCMAHEATHAALDVFKFIGADADPDNQEPFAYLVGTIMKFINAAFYELTDKTVTGHKEKKNTKDTVS